MSVIPGQPTGGGAAFVRLNKKAIDMAWIVPLRVIAVVCKKGGVGKTSFVGATAVALVSQGYRVLVVDINEQGNVSQDLGIPQTGTTQDGMPIFGDGGEGLARAIGNRQPLEPVAVPGRPGLFLCAGGPEIQRIRRYMSTVGENEAPTVLATSLQQSAGDYDYVLIDSPPDDADVIQMVIAASRYLVGPVKTDTASLLGLVGVASIYKEVRAEYNPYVELLGSFVFATSMKEGAHGHSELRGELDSMMGGHGAACPHLIPHVESVANLSRQWGMPVTELEAKAIEEGWPTRDIDILGRVAKAWVRVIAYFLSELECRRVGHPPGTVDHIDESGQPVYVSAAQPAADAEVTA